MKHFWRWTFTIASGISIALCAIAVIVPLRNYDWRYSFGHLRTPRPSGLYIRASEKQLYIFWVRDFGNAMPLAPGQVEGEASPGYERTWSFRDAEFMREKQYQLIFSTGDNPNYISPNQTGENDSLTLPWSWIIVATAILPALRVVALVWAWRLRVRPGHCPHCGYDLRATPDRCPECGTIPSIKEIIST